MTHVGERIQAWHLAVVVGISTIGMALVLYGNAPNDIEVPLLVEGTLPVLPPRSAGGGEVLLEVGIDELGLVEDMIVLTGTPPFTERA